MGNEYLRAPKRDIKIAKVVGENEDGLTLFVPKDEHGVFHLTEGDTFLSVLFVKTDGRGGVMAWEPWADGPVMGGGNV
jgi:hypothetical protein